ncbi:hypothetical protein FH972_021627 [Carpinus fangiana]|uniref:Uncharacterized protein n=1 Tax=Carpinus fangiana TaxID=176857 RepID=A0A5N6KPV0_9ROSI|nr:hypothetical protein FH972_021627 [Carpinus fangiana]
MSSRKRSRSRPLQYRARRVRRTSGSLPSLTRWLTLDSKNPPETAMVPVKQAPAILHSVHLPPGAFTMNLFLDGHPTMLGSSGAADPWIAYMKPAIDRAQHTAPLRLAAEAMSLAVFGNHDAHAEAKLLAVDRYTRCISALRAAIADPIEAAADSTLMTVLLLTIYEYITSSDESGKERFYHHTDGAIAVAVYRQKTGSVSHQQMQMFWVVITSIVMRYTYIGKSRSLTNRETPQVMGGPNRKIAIPKQANVRNWIGGLNAATSDAGGKLFELMLGTLLLRTKSHDLHLVPISLDEGSVNLVQSLFESALEMNRKLDLWDSSLPLDKQATVHNALYALFDDEVATSEIWPGELLTFTNLHDACTYSQWRSLKIMVLCVGLRNLHWLRLNTGSIDRDPVFDNMRASLYEQIDGMCASVPYFLGIKQALPPALDSVYMKRLPLDGRGALSIAVMLQFCLLVEGIPPIQRRWIQGRLKYIAEDIGVQYATVGSQTESPCLLFEGDPIMLRTFGGRDDHALSTASMSIRSFSASPAPSSSSLGAHTAEAS